MSEIVQEVLDVLRSRLISENSVLLRDPRTLDEFQRQVVDVLKDVLSRIGLPADSATVPAAHGTGSGSGTAHRAGGGVHPAEVLRAAAALFDAAFPVIVARHPSATPAQTLAVGLALHQAIMEHLTLGSLSYVDFLFATLRAARAEERRRIAREMHDRVAPGMALALQHLELHGHHATRDAKRAREKLVAAAGALGDALRTAQQLTTELRRSLGAGGIEPALRAYLRAAVPDTLRCSLEITGDPRALPPHVGEELYLLMGEAVRNAVRHAGATELRLAVVVTETLVSAVVRDDGRGFDPARARGSGLLGMGERAQLLCGALEVTSGPGRGTVVTVRVPLPGDGL